MSNPWDALCKTYNADLVGGQLIAVIDGKHTTLGHVSQGQLVLTEAGLALSKVAPLDHDGDGKRGGRKPRAEKVAEQVVEPVVEPVAEITETITATDEINVELTSQEPVADPIDED